MDNTDSTDRTGAPPEADVVVVGGGPGGAAAATLLSRAGWKTVLLERQAETGFRIGESLMPATYDTFERMGLLPKLRESRFPRKHSVQFFTKTGKASAPFYFHEIDPHERSVTWQVLRSEFDAMLLSHAREMGVDVRLNAPVKDVLFVDGRAVGVRVDDGTPSGATVRAKVVVDATGRRALLARKLGLLSDDPELRKATLFTHFEGAHRDTGIDEGATLVLHTRSENAWFWYIPLPDNRVSVGVVGAIEHLVTGRGSDPQRIFDEEVADCAPVAERIRRAKAVLPIQTMRDFSYRASRLAGDGWVLVGDAFGFLDPIYSSGVFLALKSGELAADAIDAALRDGDVSGERLGAFGPAFARGMEEMRKLVYAFYAKDFSFAKFLMRYPEHRKDITNLLVGNVFSESRNGLFTHMAQMCRLPDEAPLHTPDPPRRGKEGRVEGPAEVSI